MPDRRRRVASRSSSSPLARFREFLREPEAVFWVFAFPVIMTCALGIAFRSRGAEPVIVGVVEQAGAARSAPGARAARRLHGPDASPPAEVDRAVRDGRAPVVVVPGTPPTYRFDDARAESQVARLAVDEALQRAAGPRPTRSAPLSSPIERGGLALHRLARAGPARHEHHEHGPVGRRLRDRPGAHAEAAQAAGRDADVAGATTWRRTSSAGSLFLALETGGHRRLRLDGVRCRRARRARRAGRCSRCSARSASAGSGCSSPAARARSKACRG